MASTGSRLIVSLAMASLMAASSAAAQISNVPTGRFHHSGVYDAAQREFLIYGGFTGDQGTKMLSDLWGWDGTKWQLIGDIRVPKIVAPLAFDSKRQRTLMFNCNRNFDASDGKLCSLN